MSVSPFSCQDFAKAFLRSGMGILSVHWTHRSIRKELMQTAVPCLPPLSLPVEGEPGSFFSLLLNEACLAGIASATDPVPYPQPQTHSSAGEKRKDITEQHILPKGDLWDRSGKRYGALQASATGLRPNTLCYEEFVRLVTLNDLQTASAQPGFSRPSGCVTRRNGGSTRRA